MTVGVLGLQGDVGKHANILSSLGSKVLTVKRESELDEIDGLVIPGGESTTLSLLLSSEGMFEKLETMLTSGDLPVLGTCAGMVLLAKSLLDGKEGQATFGAIDIVVRRNAFGSQISSFEEDIYIDDIDANPFHAVFIRAPYVVSTGKDVEVLSFIQDHGIKYPVVCRENNVMVASFHPELVNDERLHKLWLEECGLMQN